MSKHWLAVVDDTSSLITYEGNWATDNSGWFGDTARISPGAHDDPTTGSVSVNFNGISIAFFGKAPPSNMSQDIQITIDGHTTNSLPPTPVKGHRPWYQSPILAEGAHSIKLDGLTQTSLDFVTVAVGEATAQAGQRIIVDDVDPSLVYSPSWVAKDKSTSSGISNDLSFGSQGHEGGRAGDQVSLFFTGTAVAVYGVTPSKEQGSMIVLYSIDVTRRDRRGQNSLLFSVDDLNAGDHNLTISIVESDGPTFVLHYLLYTLALPKPPKSPQVPEGHQQLIKRKWKWAGPMGNKFGRSRHPRSDRVPLSLATLPRPEAVPPAAAVSIEISPISSIHPPAIAPHTFKWTPLLYRSSAPQPIYLL
ncbi:hypothetical protein FPV67DRAFT_1444309 [Lyophyllum atratum]|nr:hypothetical protein FPV67DRAFT_1444309 [Lyophyllum atratum]